MVKYYIGYQNLVAEGKPTKNVKRIMRLGSKELALYFEQHPDQEIDRVGIGYGHYRNLETYMTNSESRRSIPKFVRERFQQVVDENLAKISKKDAGIYIIVLTRQRKNNKM